MFDFYFHSWVDEVFSTYLKSEFWGLKLSSSRRAIAQTGVEWVKVGQQVGRPTVSHLVVVDKNEYGTFSKYIKNS